MSAPVIRRLRVKANSLARSIAVKRASSADAILRRQLAHAIFIIAMSFVLWRALTTHFLPAHTTLELPDRRTLQAAHIAITRFRSIGSQIAAAPNSTFADDRANYHTLISDCRIPPAFVSRMDPQNRRNLLIRLSAHSDAPLSFATMPKLIVVDVQNGLGNRLRALASALEFAYFTRRVLVVIWSRDAHLDASMHHLFDSSVLQNLIVIHTPISWPIQPHQVHLPNSYPLTTSQYLPPSHPSVAYYNFMAKDSTPKSKQTPLTRLAESSHQHIYVKTAYVLRSPYAPNTLINAFVQALTPSPRVRALVRYATLAAGGENALHTMIGVHIRSRSLAQDNDQVDYQCEYSINGAAVTNSWRMQSTPAFFIPQMKRLRRHWTSIVSRSYLLTADKSELGNGHARYIVDLRHLPRFFVSVDSKAALSALYRHFRREDISTLVRDCDDRGAECAQYAFADMILLSRTGALLASGWSSFSEAAQRLRVRPPDVDPSSNAGYVVRVSGINFGWSWRQKLRIRIQSWLWGRAGDVTGFMTEEERNLICKRRKAQRSRRAGSATAG
ncbi:hypothetical protein BWQ96_02094 [Gracilariopsis chorda]|uniref:Uncharacterized protein n=1 Tax=Gracilariopsis chorda TaxID=448386 RepID=A0A2V3J151_9FLOR|nr:hypothetical protein BWQ96_02094 [Gracilariopsis chorda]|eukprot:PXF48142.1 hypothetical protein BWQ96_02094 [Gracilariopsis chorda]